MGTGTQPPQPPRDENSEEHGINGPRYSESLDTGLAILRSFSAEQPVRGIAEIADELGLSRSTTHRYLTTLVVLGYAEHGPERKYRLGLKGTNIARRMLDCHPIGVHAHPHLQELRRQVRYTVTVAILDGETVRVLERLQGYRGHARLGRTIGAASRLPLHCTGLGKVLLANLPKSESRAIITALQLRREGPKTITRKRELARELLQIQDAGFAVEDEELAAGVLSLAMPIRGDGVLGAVDLSAPVSLIDRKALIEGCGPHLLVASERIATAFASSRSKEEQ